MISSRARVGAAPRRVSRGRSGGSTPVSCACTTPPAAPAPVRGRRGGFRRARLGWSSCRGAVPSRVPASAPDSPPARVAPRAPAPARVAPRAPAQVNPQAPARVAPRAQVPSPPLCQRMGTQARPPASPSSGDTARRCSVAAAATQPPKPEWPLSGGARARCGRGAVYRCCIERGVRQQPCRHHLGVGISGARRRAPRAGPRLCLDRLGALLALLWPQLPEKDLCGGERAVSTRAAARMHLILVRVGCLRLGIRGRHRLHLRPHGDGAALRAASIRPTCPATRGIEQNLLGDGHILQRRVG